MPVATRPAIDRVMPRVTEVGSCWVFTGALSDNALIRIELDGDRYVGEERLLVDLLPYIRDVRQGPDGLLYVVTHTDSGGLYRLEPA